MARKQPGRLFLFFAFLVLFTEGVQWFYYRENYNLPRKDSTFSRGVHPLQGVQLFPGGGGSNANF